MNLLKTILISGIISSQLSNSHILEKAIPEIEYEPTIISKKEKLEEAHQKYVFYYEQLFDLKIDCNRADYVLKNKERFSQFNTTKLFEIQSFKDDCEKIEDVIKCLINKTQNEYLYLLLEGK